MHGPCLLKRSYKPGYCGAGFVWMSQRKRVTGLGEKDIGVRGIRWNHAVERAMNTKNWTGRTVDAGPSQNHRNSPAEHGWRRRFHHLKQTIHIGRTDRRRPAHYSRTENATPTQKPVRHQRTEHSQSSIQPRQCFRTQATSHQNQPSHLPPRRNLRGHHASKGSAADNVRLLQVDFTRHSNRIIRKAFCFFRRRILRDNQFTIWNRKTMKQPLVSAQTAKQDQAHCRPTPIRPGRWRRG